MVGGLLEFSPLREALGGETLPHFQAKRFMRVYTGRSVYIIKPNDRRYWCISDAQADVQLILDDQSLRPERPFARAPMPPLGKTAWKAAAPAH
jgi:hypothetical protein